MIGASLMSQTLLSTRLKELERVGVVERRGEGKQSREWHLTEAGVALGPVIQQLGEWGVQYAQDPLREGDLDVTILVWNIRRRVDPSVFPKRRVTVHIDFTDVPERTRRWWLVNDRGTVDLCPTDPGYAVDLYVTTDIRTMIAVWFGKLAWNAAVRCGRVEVIGPRQLQERLSAWFLLSSIRANPDAAGQSKTTPRAAANPVAKRADRELVLGGN
jgi:hypothetical protein